MTFTREQTQTRTEFGEIGRVCVCSRGQGVGA